MVTHALEFVFELSFMLIICDTKIVIWICALLNTIRWNCSSYSQYTCNSLCFLSLQNLVHRRHLLRPEAPASGGGAESILGGQGDWCGIYTTCTNAMFLCLQSLLFYGW